MQNMTTVKTGKNWGNVKGRENMREIEKKEKIFSGLDSNQRTLDPESRALTARPRTQYNLGKVKKLYLNLSIYFLYCFCIVIINITFF